MKQLPLILKIAGAGVLLKQGFDLFTDLFVGDPVRLSMPLVVIGVVLLAVGFFIGKSQKK